MILVSIQLKNFRSHKDISLNFSEELNYIIGGNGQGKTSILESIYYLCTTKGHNSKTDSEVVRFNENEFEVKGYIRDITDNDVRVFYSLYENKKYYFQNSKLVSRPSEIIGKYPVVILTPADHSITQGSPADRRRFVDSVISQASETYLKTLLDYNKTLRQRSALLSSFKSQNSGTTYTGETRYAVPLDEFDAWTEKLVQTGTEIINYRKKFIEEFNYYVNESYKMIMEDDETPKVSYSYLENYTGNNIYEQFDTLLKERKEEELRRAANLIGPHRDDFIFEINNSPAGNTDMNLRTYGSQGQHKTFQVVLRFAEFFYLKELTGRKPIFLLDDVFGELDAKRSVKISEYLRQVGQAFITLTDFANFSFLKLGDKDSKINLPIEQTELNHGAAVYA